MRVKDGFETVLLDTGEKRGLLLFVRSISGAREGNYESPSFG